MWISLWSTGSTRSHNLSTGILSIRMSSIICPWIHRRGAAAVVAGCGSVSSGIQSLARCLAFSCHHDVIVQRQLCSSVVAPVAIPTYPLLELFNVGPQVIDRGLAWVQNFKKQAVGASRRLRFVAAVEPPRRFEPSSLSCAKEDVERIVLM